MAQMMRPTGKTPTVVQEPAPAYIPPSQAGPVAQQTAQTSKLPYAQQGIAPQMQVDPATGTQAPAGNLGAASKLQYGHEGATNPPGTAPQPINAVPPQASQQLPTSVPGHQSAPQEIAAAATVPPGMVTGTPAVTAPPSVGQGMMAAPRQSKVAAIALAHENRVRVEVQAYKAAEVAKVGAIAAKTVTMAEKSLEHEKAKAVEERIKSDEKADHIVYSAEVKANRLVAKAKEGMIDTKAKRRQKTEQTVATAIYKAETAKAEAEEQKQRTVADIEYKLAESSLGPAQGTDKLREEARNAEVSAVKVMTRAESKKQQTVEKANQNLRKKENKVERNVTSKEVQANQLVADAKVKCAQVKEHAEQLKEQKILEATKRAEAVKQQAIGEKTQQVEEIENKVEQMVASKELPPHEAPTMMEKMKLKLVGHT